jgi:hypothetical protein
VRRQPTAATARAVAIPTISGDNIDLIPARIQNLWPFMGRRSTVKCISEFDYGPFLRSFTVPYIAIDSSGNLLAENPFSDWLLRALGRDPTSNTDRARMNISVTPSAAPSTDGVAPEFDFAAITISLPGKPASNPEYPDMAFTTDPTILAANFAGNNPIIANMPTNGLFPYHLFVALGLQTPAPGHQPWKFTQILSYTGLVSGSLGALLQVLSDMFSERPEFELAKGAIWFMKNDSYLTVQRMEWRLSQALVDAVTGILHEWAPQGLEFTEMGLIGRKTMRRQPCAADNLDGSRPPGPGEYELMGETEVILFFTLSCFMNDKKKTLSAFLDFDLKRTGATFTLTIKFDTVPDSAGHDAKDGGTTGATLTELLIWLGTLLGIPMDSVSKSLPRFEQAGVKRVQLACGKKSIDVVKVDLEFDPGWHDASGNSIIFLVGNYSATPFPSYSPFFISFLFPLSPSLFLRFPLLPFFPPPQPPPPPPQPFSPILIPFFLSSASFPSFFLFFPYLFFLFISFLLCFRFSFLCSLLFRKTKRTGVRILTVIDADCENSLSTLTPAARSILMALWARSGCKLPKPNGWRRRSCQTMKIIVSFDLRSRLQPTSICCPSCQETT